MSTFNAAAKEINLKIVYYGPGLGGKTTSLEQLHASIPEHKRPKMTSLASSSSRLASVMEPLRI